MTEGALKMLDAFVVERSGTKLGFLYEDYGWGVCF